MKEEKKTKKEKKPWPTKEAMIQIYSKNLWGGIGDDFYSGNGSHEKNIIKPYIREVSLFLASFEQPISVCDLGCGDFNIGKELVYNTSRYNAIDIVPKLIERNKSIFKDNNLEFHCLDISSDVLPKGDCAIVRQVLQHLSNAEVNCIERKLRNFKYVILTEHIPVGKFTANKDIISGQGIRIKHHSGIDLLKPPFNFEVATATTLLTVPLGNNKGVISTILYRVF